MAPQEGKDKTRKRRRADSHETLVISISSDSLGESHFASFKKKKMIASPQPRFDLNLVPEELEDHQTQSEVGDNNLNVPCFYPISHLATTCSDWRRSAARFNGEHNCMRMPASFEDLEDTASSKHPTDKAAASADDGHERLDFDLNIRLEMVPQFEHPEVEPEPEVGDNSGFNPQCFLHPDCDLEATQSGVAAASSNQDQRPADSRHTGSSDSGGSDMASSDSEDSDMTSSDSSSDSGYPDLASSASSSDAGDSDRASSEVIRLDLNILPKEVSQFDLNIAEVVP